MKNTRKQIEDKMPQCKEADCNELLVADNDGYCLRHICPPPIPLILQYLNEQDTKKKEKNEEVK
ncbi:MAG: hypothetical protein UT05_C0004G0051 [Parcubacteria group bacterium GW2011_GWF2_38_76]|nr:MAG: hypothetical protein UT05_C0004G0051 [Parcubacteria group bacterium GW2011_GWF2_38_76]HBM45646.1 hypothetical protein [Patescibacteria group bacterium]